jgi:glycosyltransferase involved in cell wall biosynthesis
MTNVLYVIWSLGLGGAEQIVISLAKGLDRNRFRPYVACLNDEGRFAEELTREGIEVFSLNKARGLDWSVVPKLVRIIRENNVNVVHAHLWGGNFWGRLAARAAKVPVVITEHGVDVWKTPFRFLIDRWLFRRTDCFIAVSEAVRSFYAHKLGVAKERISVVYNGVETGRPGEKAALRPASALREEFGIREGERVIVSIGRLVPLKGIAFLLEALARFDGNVKVLIVGDGPSSETLKAQAARLRLGDKVIFTGFRRDIPEILSIADLLVLTSSREGLPMNILEAMAAGVVVLATRVGGIPELLQDEVNGFLVEYGDVEGLKNKLEAVLSRSDLVRVRESAKRLVEEKFSLKNMVMEHERIYSLLHKSAAG